MAAQEVTKQQKI